MSSDSMLLLRKMYCSLFHALNWEFQTTQNSMLCDWIWPDIWRVLLSTVHNLRNSSRQFVTHTIKNSLLG
jgi:hypothetical protein